MRKIALLIKPNGQNRIFKYDAKNRPKYIRKGSKKGAKQSKLYAKVYLFVSQLKPKIMRNGSFHIHFATKREKKNLPIK
jgi:hypothetical protein